MTDGLHTPNTTGLSPPDRAIEETRWDVVVVGSGLAGLTAAAVAARSGASVALMWSTDSRPQRSMNS